MKKGIVVNVLRDADGYDCTMNGISARFEELVLIGDDIRNPDTTPSKTRPAIKIIEVNILGDRYLKAVPVNSKGECMMDGMFGGNYIKSSEARFTNLYKHPIPVHDRFEK